MKKVSFKASFKKVLWNGFCFLCLWQQSAWAETYTASYKGFSGRAELDIVQDATDYRVTLAIYPDSLLAKLAISSLVDSSQGTINQGHYTPGSYRRVKNGDKPMLSVDFLGDKVSVVDKNGSKEMAISALGQDPLSQIVQIQHDLRLGQLQSAYYLVTNHNERRYDVSWNQQSANAGYQVTLTEHPSKHRVLQLWFDETLTLKKMQKVKNGELDLQIDKQ